MAVRILQGVHRELVRVAVMPETERLKRRQAVDLFMDGKQSARLRRGGFFMQALSV